MAEKKIDQITKPYIGLIKVHLRRLKQPYTRTQLILYHHCYETAKWLDGQVDESFISFLLKQIHY